MGATRILGLMLILGTLQVMTTGRVLADTEHDHAAMMGDGGSTSSDGSWLTVVAIAAVAVLVFWFHRRGDATIEDAPARGDSAPTRR